MRISNAIECVPDLFTRHKGHGSGSFEAGGPTFWGENRLRVKTRGAGLSLNKVTVPEEYWLDPLPRKFSPNIFEPVVAHLRWRDNDHAPL